MVVGLGDVAVDGGHEVLDGAKHVAPECLAGQLREEVLDEVQPGA